MTLALRRVMAASAATVILCGVLAVGAAPVRAATTPTFVTASGSADVAVGYSTFSLTIRPWQIFGTPLGIGSVSGSLSGGDSHNTSTTQQCLFGLGWNMRTVSTPRRSVTFTCLMIGINDILGQKIPFLVNQTISVVDGPGGTIDYGQGQGPQAESPADPILVAFF